jgi:hypothetical protein
MEIVNRDELPEYIKTSITYLKEFNNEEPLYLDPKFIKNFQNVENDEEFSIMFDQVNYLQVIDIPNCFFDYMVLNYNRCFNIIINLIKPSDKLINDINGYIKNNNISNKNEIIDAFNFFLPLKYQDILTVYIKNSDKIDTNKIINNLVTFDLIVDLLFRGTITNSKCLCYINMCYRCNRDIELNNYKSFCDIKFINYLSNSDNYLVNDYPYIFDDITSSFRNFNIETYYKFVNNIFSLTIIFKLDNIEMGISVTSCEYRSLSVKQILNFYKEIVENLERDILFPSKYGHNILKSDHIFLVKNNFSNILVPGYISIITKQKQKDSLYIKIPFNRFNKHEILEGLLNIDE